jgi:hypothetical protein
MKNVKDLKDEMEHMIGRADDKFDEAAKMMDNYLENALTKVSISLINLLTNMYTYYWCPYIKSSFLSPTISYTKNQD